ncbi:hypothetical protein AK88_05580 [Plasmodium fragile]|uniref:Schizont-infected cell agglutination extracellular alpha domain-containing protein n=1 Tax=Plasmodium fragile TaxID=5857 RepID=A0A0D9QCQ4_PLAFR|nr:uncharacterized protein AK88_05580 [Plasmodium fragile]KJP84788.1 hypothetical protein AK88_05580 [Plasmodium fragile]
MYVLECRTYGLGFTMYVLGFSIYDLGSRMYGLEVDDFRKKLMKDVDRIFRDVTQSINQHSGSNAGICGSIYTGQGQHMCKSRCMEIANLMLYIRGYDYKGQTEGWQKRNVNKHSPQLFREYLKCTLATAVLLQVYGQTSDHKDIITKVQQEMRKTNNTGNMQYEPGVCESRDYGDVIFGLRGIGPSINTKLQHWKSGLAGGQAGRARVTTHTCAWADHDGEDSEQKCNVQDGAPPQTSELMTKIKAWTDTPTFGRVKKVLDNMQKEEASKGKCELHKKIKAQVQAVKNTAEKRDEATLRKEAPKKTVTTPAVQDSGAKFNVAAPAPRPPTGSNGPAKPAPATPPGKDGKQ